MSTPEGLVKNAICSYLALKCVYFWVNDSVGIFDPIKRVYRMNRNPYRKRGVADILGVLDDGRMLAIEVKSKTGRVTPEQVAFIQAVSARGGVAFFARGIEDVERELFKKGKVK